MLSAPAKEFKAVNDTFSRMIRVMTLKQKILFSEVSEHPAHTKIRESLPLRCICRVPPIVLLGTVARF